MNSPHAKRELGITQPSSHYFAGDCMCFGKKVGKEGGRESVDGGSVQTSIYQRAAALLPKCRSSEEEGVFQQL